MKPFFLYFSAGLLSLYVFFFGSEFDINWSVLFSDNIINAFTISFLAAANISLFRKKAAAVIGLAAFSPALVWAIFITIKTGAALGIFGVPFLIVFTLLLLVSYAVFYSIKSLFFTNELKWNTGSQVIYILRLILIGIQICIFWVILNQS